MCDPIIAARGGVEYALRIFDIFCRSTVIPHSYRRYACYRSTHMTALRCCTRYCSSSYDRIAPLYALLLLRIICPPPDTSAYRSDRSVSPSPMVAPRRYFALAPYVRSASVSVFSYLFSYTRHEGGRLRRRRRRRASGRRTADAVAAASRLRARRLRTASPSRRPRVRPKSSPRRSLSQASHSPDACWADPECPSRRTVGPPHVILHELPC